MIDCVLDFRAKELPGHFGFFGKRHEHVKTMKSAGNFQTVCANAGLVETMHISQSFIIKRVSAADKADGWRQAAIVFGSGRSSIRRNDRLAG